MSLAASGTTATIAAVSATGACWLARINMQIDGGRVPNGTQFAGRWEVHAMRCIPPLLGGTPSFRPGTK
jgi:hypothetical protein